MPFGFLTPKDFLLIDLFNLSILGVPDEGFSRDVSNTLN
jgi:hypothetical protein